MDEPRLRHVEDVSATAWIGPRPTAFGSGVTSLVPVGFAAYAQIAHDTVRRYPAGELPAASRTALLKVLAACGATADCWFAFWEGHGWENTGTNIDRMIRCRRAEGASRSRAGSAHRDARALR